MPKILWSVQWECCEWTEDPGVACSIPFRKFRFQRCPSLRSAASLRSRWNFATGRARPTSKLSGNSVGTKHHPHDSLQSFEKSRIQKKLDVWVPHELTQRNLIGRITISEMLLKRNELEPFWKRIITGDEKWVKYENIKRKRSWSKAGDLPQTTSKAGLSAKKVMLSVWWVWKGIVNYELLQPGATINSVL